MPRPIFYAIAVLVMYGSVLYFICGCSGTIKELSDNHSAILLQGHTFTVGVNPVTMVPGVSYTGGTVVRYNPAGGLKIKITNDGANATVLVIGNNYLSTPIVSPTPVVSPVATINPTPTIEFPQ